MSSQLYNDLGGQSNGMMNMFQQLIQYRRNFIGDPKAKVEKLLQSGQMSQGQLNQLQQMASQLQNVMQNMR